jgi:hypothetical protein
MLRLELDQGSGLAQFTTGKLQFKGSEAQYIPSLVPMDHECLAGSLAHMAESSLAS